MNSPEILAIDDEAAMRKLLQITLESNDFSVRTAATGRGGLAAAAQHPPALILLDLGLPDEHGHSVLQQLREWYTAPIIILSAQTDEDDIVRALDSGANDYLTKPFRTGELLARIRSAMRGMRTDGADPIVRIGELELNLAARTLKRGGEVVKLTATEWNLFALFAKNAGRVLTHHYLLREVWGPGYQTQSQYLRVFVAQLRKKIEADPNRPQYLLTESGVGYRLADTS